MTPLLTKALIGTGVVGVTVAGAGTIYGMSNSSEKEDKNKEKTSKKVTISSLLTGKRLLTKNSDDTSKWTEPGTQFKQKYNTKDPTTPGKFTNGTAEKVDNTGLDSFKDQCVSLGATEVENKNDPIFKEVDAHCTTAA